jgi:hypothetical protein
MEDNEELKRRFTAFRKAAEAVDDIRSLELVGMTDEEAFRRMKLLKVVGTPWRERHDWSGLVEQQEIFMRGRNK